MWPFKKKSEPLNTELTKEDIYKMVTEYVDEVIAKRRNVLKKGTELTPKNIRACLKNTLPILKMTTHPEAWLYTDDKLKSYAIFYRCDGRHVTLPDEKKIENSAVLLVVYLRNNNSRLDLFTSEHVVSEKIIIDNIEDIEQAIEDWLPTLR